ncbi:aspartate kinase [Halosquirtibacter xylanolyticus]|uniref:aspartate kinase n=1 Tax=Halosquirtibacter xylanolyticus TaxID=3374599 RepID=UPI0037489AF7|nr:aspartate kinase [Prolixibacteraceae bacterium]
MKVLKFGGTSVGSVENMKTVMDIVTDGEKKLVVLSAMSGTTNTLVEIADYLAKKNKDSARFVISKLEKQYYQTIREMYHSEEIIERAFMIVEDCFDTIKSFTSGEFTENGEKNILAQGEIISSNLFNLLLIQEGYKSTLLSALDFMKIDSDKSADQFYIEKNVCKLLEENPSADYYITQGFICLNSDDEIDNLQRGGSDYTASLIGAAIKAEEVQIWTDIDGFHNNDPREVENTKKVDSLSFDEAAELAYFGAKILHPQTVLPAKLANIPVRLKNTMNRNDEGTIIRSQTGSQGLKAVAAKDGITAVKIRSGRMLNAYGFLKNIFEIFEFFKTPIDMITTSEVAVSVTIDDPKNLDAIVMELKEYGDVELDVDQTIICIVGNMISTSEGLAMKVFDALGDIPVRMISYGGSDHNISVLVSTEDKKRTLQAISNHLLD